MADRTSRPSPATTTLHGADLGKPAFIQDGATGRRVPQWWLAILIFLAIFATQIAILAAFTIAWETPSGSWLAQVQEGIANLITILLVLGYVRFREGRAISTLGLRHPGRGALTLLGGVAIGLVMISIPILLLWSTGNYESAPVPAGGASGLSVLPLVIALGLTVILQGSNEELLTRGFLLQALGHRFRVGIAVAVTAVIFTVVHGVVGNPLAFVTIISFAVFAAFLVLSQRALWMICGIHAGWNFGLGNVYGIPVSGLEPHANSLLFLQPAAGAPEWLTGGDFGTEGGLPAALTMLAAAVIAFALYRMSRTAAAAETAAPTPAVAARSAQAGG